MKLILVRHGQALNGAVDDERKLSELGIEQINQAAEFLRQRNISVDQTFHSGKKRAQQTAQIIQDNISPNVKMDTLEILKPNAPPKELINYLSKLSDSSLMVGHLPHVRDFVYELLGQNDMRILQDIPFNPGTTLVLNSDDMVDWRIEAYFDPELV